MFLKVSSISFTAHGHDVVSNVSFTQSRNQKIAIVGETGSGKSTVLKIIAGLIQPTKGQVFLDENAVAGPADKLVPGHPDIQYLSQHFELPRSLRVEQVLTYANMLTEEQASSLFRICDIEHLMLRRTDELSGGEKQRIALARILISSPRLILLDEPFSNLDTVHRTILQKVIRNICKRLKVGCVLVSHDPEDILPWADQVIILRHGIIVQKATVEEVYHFPVDEYVAGLFGKYNVVRRQDYPNLFSVGDSQRSIFRPEEFHIAKKSSKTIPAVIEEITFQGSYYQVSVNTRRHQFLVNTMDRTHQVGQKIFLRLKPSAAG